MSKRKRVDDINGAYREKKKVTQIDSFFETNFPMDVFPIICSYLTSKEWRTLMFTGNKYLVDYITKNHCLSLIYWKMTYKKNKKELIYPQIIKHPRYESFKVIEILNLNNMINRVVDPNSNWWTQEDITHFISKTLCNLRVLHVKDSFIGFVDLDKRRNLVNLGPYFEKLEKLSLRNSDLYMENWPKNLRNLSVDFQSLIMSHKRKFNWYNCIICDCVIEIVLNDNNKSMEIPCFESLKKYFQFISSFGSVINTKLITCVKLDIRLLCNYTSKITEIPPLVQYCTIDDVMKRMKNRHKLKLINPADVSIEGHPQVEWIKKNLEK